MGDTSLLSPKGRMGRIEFIFLQLSIFVVMFFSLAAVYSFGSASLMSFLGIGMFLLCCFSLLMTVVQRLHDFNASGWWLFVCIVFPFLLPILFLVLLIIPSSRNVNNYDFEQVRSTMKPKTTFTGQT